jgi:hypothetical protein
MTRITDKRSRLGGLFAAALAALAIVALPGLASARDDSGASATTIKSFDATTATLVLSLPDGGTLSGVVGRRTKIRCEDQSGHRRGRHEVRGREAEPGDDHGGHGNEAGDDNGGRGVEPGDDNGGRGVEPGDDNGGDSSGPGPSGSAGHDDNGHGANCTVADLAPGATVDEVEVDFGRGSVRFDEVELAG